MVTRTVRSIDPRSAGDAARKATGKAVKDARRVATGVLGLAGERMTKVDTAWLRMDCDHNLMMIVGVWTLRPAIDHDALCTRVQSQLLCYSRFRQRPMASR